MNRRVHCFSSLKLLPKRCGCADRSWWLEPGYHLSYMEDYPPYPFQRIKRVTGKDTGVMAIIAPFYDLDYYKVNLRKR